MADQVNRDREDRWAWGDDDYSLSQCVYCVWKWVGRPGCAAFPDAIPDAILLNEFDHRNPYPGDHGIRFKPRPRPKE